MTTIPSIYQVITDKFQEDCDGNFIEVRRAREILTYIFRMPRQKVNTIFKELSEMGLVRFENCRSLEILK